jgi:hypothetical protein
MTGTVAVHLAGFLSVLRVSGKSREMKMAAQGTITGRIIVRTTTMQSNRKPKKSYTLSRESVAFLEAMRKKHRARSVSSVLEEILQALRRQQERSTIDQAVARYYTSLSATEAAEQSQWGELASHEFPGES